MTDKTILDAARLFLELVECGHAEEDEETGANLFITDDGARMIDIFERIRSRGLDDPEFIESLHNLMTGTFIYAQKMTAATGGDFTSRVLAADIANQNRRDRDAT